MTKRLLSLVLALLALGSARASAQATLVTGLGGPLDFGTTTLARGDDAAGMLVDLTPIFAQGFDFYGHHYTGVYVNTNGNVSFDATVTTFTPSPFPLQSSPNLHPLIAAWWGDVDTRVPIPGMPDHNLVYYALDVPNLRFVATWVDVGYFNQHDDLLNAFQIILTQATGGTSFDAELRYHRCEWTTGDFSGGHGGFGGIPAQAGFDATDGVNFLSLPGSLTMDVLSLCTTSNVGSPGVWQLHGAAMPVCGDHLRQTGEECDDGNTTSGDGCDATCHLECPGRPDAGMDAGAHGSCTDAGLPPIDAARPRGDSGPPAVDVTGGGCSCSVGAAPRLPAALPLAVLLLLSASRRRRRRRDGGTS